MPGADTSGSWPFHEAVKSRASHNRLDVNQLQHSSVGFLVSCFHYKLKGASAGFTRAVALFEDQ
jgi:hypothetical protein